MLEGQRWVSKTLTCEWMLMKQTPLGLHSHSVFYPQPDLKQFTSLVRDFYLLHILAEQSTKKHTIHYPQDTATLELLNSFLTPGCFYFIPWENHSILQYSFHPERTNRANTGCPCRLFQRFKSQLPKQFFESILLCGLLEKSGCTMFFVYGGEAKGHTVKWALTSKRWLLLSAFNYKIGELPLGIGGKRL